jgi:Skp family chaperone for outer membrane proteins
MLHSHRRALTAAGLVLGLLAAATAKGQIGEIAVIDLGKVFDGYALTHDLESKFEQQQRTLQTEAEKKRSEILLRREALASFKPGTPDYKARRKELTQLQFEFDVWAGMQEQELREAHKQWMLRIYRNIHRAVETLSRERNISVVLTYQAVTDEAPDSKTLRQQLLLEKVFYFKERLDLTQSVLERVNKEYQGPETIDLSSRTTKPNPDRKVAAATS